MSIIQSVIKPLLLPFPDQITLFFRFLITGKQPVGADLNHFVFIDKLQN